VASTFAASNTINMHVVGRYAGGSCTSTTLNKTKQQLMYCVFTGDLSSCQFHSSHRTTTWGRRKDVFLGTMKKEEERIKEECSSSFPLSVTSSITVLEVIGEEDDKGRREVIFVLFDLWLWWHQAL
jgi:hypothetical protein